MAETCVLIEFQWILSRPPFPHYRRKPVSTIEVGPGFRRDSGIFDPANLRNQELGSPWNNNPGGISLGLDYFGQSAVVGKGPVLAG